MCARLEEMVQRMYEMGLKQRAAQLQALQAMINPHFLYNCLSSIKWKAIKAEQEDISEITGLLAKFYRTVLNEGRQMTVVRNELENIRAYLELQNKTHDSSFQVIYHLDEDGLELEMPNFLLQPIVENAICHGIEYIQEGDAGRITVEYIHEGDFLIFHILNNGPQPELAHLQDILDTPGKGYGLYNIQERIRMYYDEQCGVSITITQEGETCFTVRIRDYLTHTTAPEHIS